MEGKRKKKMFSDHYVRPRTHSLRAHALRSYQNYLSGNILTWPNGILVFLVQYTHMCYDPHLHLYSQFISYLISLDLSEEETNSFIQCVWVPPLNQFTISLLQCSTAVINTHITTATSLN